MNLAHLYYSFTRDFTNLSVVHRRHFDGYMVSMHQSGSHWLKSMLCHVICFEYDVPVPRHIADHTVVGSVKSPPAYDQIPRIVTSHTIPSVLASSRLVRALVRLPPRILLVRDLRATLVSHYEKWKDRYGVSFSEFLRGDPLNKRFDKDIWWDIRFYNAWGRFAARWPDDTQVIRYEALERDPIGPLRAACRFLGIRVRGERSLVRAIEESSKEKMVRLESNGGLQVVRRDERNPMSWYSQQDRHFVTQICARYLKYTFGYDFNRWE